MRAAAALLSLLLSLGPARAEPAIFVTSQDGGTVTRIDGLSAAVPVPVGAGAAQIAAAGDGTLYLTHPDRHAITVVDARSGRVLRRLDFSGQPFGIAVSADGVHLYVGDWQGGRLVRLDARTGAVQGEIAVGAEPAGLVLGPDGRLFVALRGADAVAAVDTGAMALLGRVPVGRAPFALALSEDGGRLFVGNVRSNDLTEIDTGTLKPVATRAAGRSPYGVAVQDGRVLVTNQETGAVSLLGDAAEARRQIPVGRYPEGIATAGGRAYVANWFSDDVSVIDLAEMREVARLKVPGGPRAVIAVSPMARKAGP